MHNFINLFMDKKGELFQLFMQHLNMTTIAVFISLLIGIPTAILITRNKTASKIVIGIANVMQSIPCIALLAFAVPFVGIGAKPAILMVIVYALLPIIKNTYTGITSIDPKTVEVAKGLGLSKGQRLLKVEMPIAMPFIMAGIRISAVAAVGTMTIAAFAGAGGLGWFINLGLNSRNPGLVLLGAIPASLLALIIDFILARLEHAITSEGLLPADKIKNVSKSVKRRERALIYSLCALLVILPAASSISTAFANNRNKIVVGSSNFTEALILGYMYSDLIESNTDLEVEQKFNLNGASFCFDSLTNEDIDMFVEYTGSALSTMLHEPIENDKDTVYNKVKKLMMERHNISVSEPIGFNNTYVMSVKPETAEKYNLKTLSDLIKNADKLDLGCTVEFVQREDCLPLLEKQYNMKFKKVSGLDAAIRYQAVDSDEVQVVDAFSTDALLAKLGLTTLEDDVHFFPPYYAINFTNQKVLDEHPELKPVLAKMDGLIDEKTMADLNSQVDIDGRDPKDVAHDFLVEKGLIEK